MGVVDPATGHVEEEDFVARAGFAWLGGSWLGRRLRPALYSSRRLHRLVGWYADTRHSRRLIPWAARRFGVRLSEALVPPGGYATFNDFFTRELAPGARPFDGEPEALVSPADARLFVVPRIAADTELQVKEARFTVGRLLADEALAAAYAGGAAAVFRLYLADCHRLYFPCDGVAHPPRSIPGEHHPVSPVPGAESSFYTRNVRQVALLDTERFGRLAFVDIGGFLISSIEPRCPEGGRVRRGGERLRFRFGGSTCVLLSEPGRLQYAADLVRWCQQGHEVRVRIGARLAGACPS